MKIAVKTIEGDSAGEIDLADAVFGAPVRKDILQRCVVWQLSRRQQGTHKTKGRAEVTATAKKMYAQKGTGQARHGNQAAPQFRGGGKAFGPVVRSHASDLPKKVRKLALRCALSSKAAEGKLIVLDQAALAEPKTAKLKGHFGKLGVTSVLIIAGAEVDTNFARAAANIAHVDVLPQQGANVYDILRRDTLVLTKDAVEASRGAPPMSARPPIKLTVSRARMYEVIRAPLITEKTTNGSEHSQVTFKVAADATKPEIKQAVEGLFKVKVKAVNTVNVQGKKKLFKGRPGVRGDWKKAIVSLVEGHKIDVTTGL